MKGLHTKKHGGQPALSEEFEEILVRALDKITDWKVPFDGYNNIRCFIKRHNLTKKISDNVKAARAGVTRDIIKNYFSHLEKWVIVP